MSRRKDSSGFGVARRFKPPSTALLRRCVVAAFSIRTAIEKANGVEGRAFLLSMTLGTLVSVAHTTATRDLLQRAREECDRVFAP